eukprot:COSAG05_NODE_6290_length_985_cov_1.735892_1_plen_41_part_10
MNYEVTYNLFATIEFSDDSGTDSGTSTKAREVSQVTGQDIK